MSGRCRRTPLLFSVKPPARGRVLIPLRGGQEMSDNETPRFPEGTCAGVGAGTPESSLHGGEQAAGSRELSEAQAEAPGAENSPDEL